MAHPYHHALSSVDRWGGTPEDYLPIHNFFDETKSQIADFRHRALRHHAEGIFLCERIFGITLTISTGRVIPVRFIAEQHITEDCGFIPTASDWLEQIQSVPWMRKVGKKLTINSFEGSEIKYDNHQEELEIAGEGASRG